MQDRELLRARWSCGAGRRPRCSPPTRAGCHRSPRPRPTRPRSRRGSIAPVRRAAAPDDPAPGCPSAAFTQRRRSRRMTARHRAGRGPPRGASALRRALRIARAASDSASAVASPCCTAIVSSEGGLLVRPGPERRTDSGDGRTVRGTPDADHDVGAPPSRLPDVDASAYDGSGHREAPRPGSCAISKRSRPDGDQGRRAVEMGTRDRPGRRPPTSMPGLETAP